MHGAVTPARFPWFLLLIAIVGATLTACDAGSDTTARVWVPIDTYESELITRVGDGKSPVRLDRGDTVRLYAERHHRGGEVIHPDDVGDYEAPLAANLPAIERHIAGDVQWSISPQGSVQPAWPAGTSGTYATLTFPDEGIYFLSATSRDRLGRELDGPSHEVVVGKSILEVRIAETVDGTPRYECNGSEFSSTEALDPILRAHADRFRDSLQVSRATLRITGSPDVSARTYVPLLGAGASQTNKIVHVEMQPEGLEPLRYDWPTDMCRPQKGLTVQLSTSPDPGEMWVTLDHGTAVLCSELAAFLRSSGEEHRALHLDTDAAVRFADFVEVVRDFQTQWSDDAMGRLDLSLPQQLR